MTEYVLGTSAGPIVAATLMAGRRFEVGDRVARDCGAEVVAGEEAARRDLGAALRYLGGEVVRPPRPERRLDRFAQHLDGLGAQFDGRLRVAAVDRRRGRRVMFGAPGAPVASVRDAVLASCAVPWLFAPAEIGGPRVRRRRRLEPDEPRRRTGRPRRPRAVSRPTAALAPLRAVTTAALAEELAVRGRGMRVRTIVPDADSVRALGPDLMDPRRSDEVLDAAFAQGCVLAA